MKKHPILAALAALVLALLSTAAAAQAGAGSSGDATPGSASTSATGANRPPGSATSGSDIGRPNLDKGTRTAPTVESPAAAQGAIGRSTQQDTTTLDGEAAPRPDVRRRQAGTRTKKGAPDQGDAPRSDAVRPAGEATSDHPRRKEQP